jgi:hypothetical protein
MNTAQTSQSTLLLGSRLARMSICGQLAPVVLVLLLGAAACVTDGESGEQDEAAERAAATSARPAVAVADAGVVLTVPQAVESLGNSAEDAYDQAKLGNWARALDAVDSLRASADRLTPASGESTPSVTDVRASVDALARSVTAHDRPSALREANGLTALGARLSQSYHPQVPVDVTMLDYYGRELEIWSSANDLPRLHATAAALRSSWDAVHPAVIARGGTAESAQFEALVQRVEVARTAAAFGATATPVLDAVDVLEAVFRR